MTVVALANPLAHANQVFFAVYGTKQGDAASTAAAWYYPVYKAPIEGVQMVTVRFNEHPCLVGFIPTTLMQPHAAFPYPYPSYVSPCSKAGKASNACYSHAEYLNLQNMFIGLQYRTACSPPYQSHACYLLELKARNMQVS